MRERTANTMRTMFDKLFVAQFGLLGHLLHELTVAYMLRHLIGQVHNVLHFDARLQQSVPQIFVVLFILWRRKLLI